MTINKFLKNILKATLLPMYLVIPVYCPVSEFMNPEYIMVKNSWGTSWGMDGYIYFSADVDNLCGIAQHCSYPKI